MEWSFMKRNFVHGALVCALGLMVAACVTASENTSLPEDTSAEAIQSWVARNRAHLPTDYDELSRLPWAYRRVVFAELPPATRSALFRTHFERYAQAHPNMSPSQSAVLERAKELMTPDVYALPHESPEWKARVGTPQEELEHQARAVFDRAELARIFAMIGPEDPVKL